ncbi:hypothetical protein H4R33_005510 [Dimargaris cristalligena]|nr:hypothetical protein H4R33_005510 [Dimargaris cristalligena]
MSVATYDTSYSIVLRFHGSVVPHVAPAVIFFAAWSAAVVAVDKYTVLNLGITNSIITILAFVISLLLVFRTNTAYDRYWEGRKVWSQMVLAIRNLARLLWTIIPEELASEKDVAVHLLHAFAVAVKCYLHGTDPFVEMEHIEAIRPVIPTLREYYQAIMSQHQLSDGWARDPTFLDNMEPQPRSPTYDDMTQTNTPADKDRRDSTLDVSESDNQTRLRSEDSHPTFNHPPSASSSTYPLDTLNNSKTSQKHRVDFNEDIAEHEPTFSPAATKSRRRRNLSIAQLVRRGFRSDSVTAEDLQSENATVPYVVSLFISNYIVHAKDEGHIDAVHLGLILNAINTLTECLTGYERIQRTPIPVAYAIHLHQTVLLYCLALPFQLLPLLNWVTVPITAIVAFTMLGVLHIGKEIENPFGDDDNDLPLDDFCKVIGHEINDVTSYNAPSVADWMVAHRSDLDEPTHQARHSKSE